jgi:hypothetical protein
VTLHVSHGPIQHFKILVMSRISTRLSAQCLRDSHLINMRLSRSYSIEVIVRVVYMGGEVILKKCPSIYCKVKLVLLQYLAPIPKLPKCFHFGSSKSEDASQPFPYTNSHQFAIQ